MPQIQGNSNENIHTNIKKLIGEGYKRKQAVAIAYSEAEKAKRKEDQESGKPYSYKNSCITAPAKETQQFPYI